MRLKRRGLIQGYIKVPELSKNGKQHLHVLYRGSYIDMYLISHWWQEIHKAKVIGIRRVRYSNSKRHIASYMAKYMSKEGLYRYSWSWGWVWRGFVKDWENLKRQWHKYNENFGYHSFAWLLSQWKYCLVYNLRPQPICPFEPP